MLVDLSYFGKSELPTELFSRVAITRLILRSHGLRGLNPLICELRNLRQLDLCSYNPLTKEYHTNLDRVPDTLCLLKNLVQLDLSFNGLCSLPYNIHHLKSLKCLNISYNQLTDVPATLYQLEGLQLLNIRANKMSFLHPDVGKLKSLAQLDVAENMIEEIPSSIGSCKLLSVLLLDSLWLSEVPDTVAELLSLTIIDLSNNPRLRSLPVDAFLKLSHLHALHIKDSKQLTGSHFSRLRHVLKDKCKSDIAANQWRPFIHNFDVFCDRKIINELVNE